MASIKKQVVIVSPALADANNGNWQTARRWQKFLQTPTAGHPGFQARIVTQWPDGPAAAQDSAMIALHARRSAASVKAWAQSRGRGAALQPVPGLAVVLTGTDLYRDIQTDAQAQQSLQWAQRLVVLQALGLAALPPSLQFRTDVIFQSTSARQRLPKSARFIKAVMVGHLRDEKSPQTLFAAARLLKPHEAIHIDHIGAPLDAVLALQAQATAATCPGYRWLGALPHEATRRRIQRAHVLVHTSRMEGGAHVVMEAVRAGTPVLASRIDGNVGMLGSDYAGYFDWDHAEQLVDLLRRCHVEPAFYAHLQAQCVVRAPLFAPETERRALQQLVTQLSAAPPRV
ncbi:selenoneine biosynthesis selenosugar synthase SenB [Rhodoferax sp.]|uniref:selenoneine biosynthesis selenosugar synthase SenB n=1 Tax=Rhodoferax sp. TaxID=50421 RepID=UPI002726EC8E|nr:selenoneine biosynthesis selenosugar synthase SenB [Rhodoferax sp.]MDO9144340.1 selenoneine biosynthesis selenosugar synthase SenB [Rhodoferax sp.]